MSIGRSGRIVIEIDPAIKRELYSKLSKEGRTLKDWFLLSTSNYMLETEARFIQTSIIKSSGDKLKNDIQTK